MTYFQQIAISITNFMDYLSLVDNMQCHYNLVWLSSVDSNIITIFSELSSVDSNIITIFCELSSVDSIIRIFCELSSVDSNIITIFRELSSVQISIPLQHFVTIFSRQQYHYDLCELSSIDSNIITIFSELSSVDSNTITIKFL